VRAIRSWRAARWATAVSLALSASCGSPPIAPQPRASSSPAGEVRKSFGAFAAYTECAAVNAEATLGQAMESLLGPRRPAPASTLAQCITTPLVPTDYQTPVMPERPILPVVRLTGATDASLLELLLECRRLGLTPVLTVDAHGRVAVRDTKSASLLKQLELAPSANKDDLAAELRNRGALAAELEARLTPLGIALHDSAVASQSAYVQALNIVFYSHMPDDAGGIQKEAARPLFEQVMAHAMRADRCQAAAAGLLALAQAVLRGRGAPGDLGLAATEVQWALSEPAVISADDLAEAWNPAMARAARMRSAIARWVRTEKRQGIAPPRAPSKIWAATDFGTEADVDIGIVAVLSGDVVGAIRAGDVLFDVEWPIRDGVGAVASVIGGDPVAAVSAASALVPGETGVGRALVIARRVVQP
jgi:hypothetical protein